MPQGGPYPPQYGPPQQYGPPPGYGPPQQQYGPPPMAHAVVIDVAGAGKRQVIAGGVALAVFGVIGVVAGLAGAVDGGSGVATAAVIIGVLFLLPLVFVAAKWKVLTRPRRLVFEPRGIRWDDPQGTPWAMGWAELGAVSVSKHGAKEVPRDFSQAMASKATEKMLGERVHVRLDLFPADPAFPTRHPEMAHLWQQQGVLNGYRLPLGVNPKFIPLIEQGMRTFRPQVYRGVQETRGFMGLR